MQRLKVKNTHPANLLSFVVVRGGHGVSLWRKTLPGAAAFSSSLQSMRLCCSFPIAVCIQIVSASWGFECVYQRRARLCCDRLDSELFWVHSGTENSPSLPARPDLFCHFSVLRSLVFLFVLLSSISGGGSLINGNTESNLPVIH